MVHIRSFRESAGQLCRQVTEEEIARLMNGQTPETFTTSEVMSLVGQLKGLSRNAEIEEFFFETDKLYSFLFWYYYCEVKLLRRFDILHARSGGSYTSKQMVEGVEANNLFIVDIGLDKNKAMDIFRSTDDWIYVAIDIMGDDIERPTPAAEFWVCDGIAGLKSLIVDFIERRKKEDPL